MRVAALVVAVGDDHVGALRADHRDQPADGLVDRRLVERLGMVVGVGVGHARVAVAEHDDLVEADDLRRAGQLSRAQLGQALLLLLGVRPWNGWPGSRSAGFCRSPSSPPVQHTSTVCTPWALYIASVGAPFEASSSGWAWTVSRQSRSFTTVNAIERNPQRRLAPSCVAL